MPPVESPSLSDLQQWMRWVLTHPHGVGCALKNHKHPLGRCLRVIGETPTVSREKRLSIYGNGYFGRIVDVLGANFSSIKNIIGEDNFDEMARSYLVKHPSTFKSIDDIGDQMPGFLKRHPLTKRFPFLPQLAAVEWAAHQSFFADDVPLLNPQSFKKMPESKWRGVKLTLDPSVRLLHVNWPVDEIWRKDGKLDKRQVGKIKKGNFHILVYRQTNKMVRMPRISAIQFDLLTQIRVKPLGKALFSLVKKHTFNGEALPIKGWFNDWVTDGIIKKINFGSTTVTQPHLITIPTSQGSGMIPLDVQRKDPYC